ncbi:MAG: Flagellar basal-body rod protein FlgF, partial [uncultured Solirubrobacterales bacterium]
GPWPLHRRLRHARRAGAPGADRERPLQRLDPRLQGRPDRPARLRRDDARQRRDRPGHRPAGDRGAGRRRADRLDPHAGPGDGRAARLRDHRRGLLRGADRSRRAVHAQRPVHRLAAGHPRHAAGRSRPRPRRGARAGRRRRPRRSAPAAGGQSERPPQGRRLARRRQPRRRPGRPGPRRRPGGLRRRSGPLHGRHDRLHARLRGRPARHHDDRRDAGQGREPGGELERL